MLSLLDFCKDIEPGTKFDFSPRPTFYDSPSTPPDPYFPAPKRDVGISRYPRFHSPPQSLKILCTNVLVSSISDGVYDLKSLFYIMEYSRSLETTLIYDSCIRRLKERSDINAQSLLSLPNWDAVEKLFLCCLAEKDPELQVRLLDYCLHPASNPNIANYK